MCDGNLNLSQAWWPDRACLVAVRPIRRFLVNQADPAQSGCQGHKVFECRHLWLSPLRMVCSLQLSKVRLGHSNMTLNKKGAAMKRFILIGMLFGALIALTVSQTDAQVGYQRSFTVPSPTYSYYAGPRAYFYDPQGYSYPWQSYYQGPVYFSYPQGTYRYTTPGGYYNAPGYYAQIITRVRIWEAGSGDEEGGAC